MDLCPEFTIDDSEKLLDDYGLLLFKSYEDRGNGIDLDGLLSLSYFNFSGDHELFSDREINPVILNTKVNEDNRRNTVLIAKDFIELDDDILHIMLLNLIPGPFLYVLSFYFRQLYVVPLYDVYLQQVYHKYYKYEDIYPYYKY